MMKAILIISLILILGSFGSLMAQQCTVTVTIGEVTISPCVPNRLDIPVYMNNPCTVGGFSMQIKTTVPAWLKFDVNDPLAADTIGSRNPHWGFFMFQVHPMFEKIITVSAIGSPYGDNLPPGDGLIFTLHIDFDDLGVSDTCQLIYFNDSITNISDSTGYITYPKVLIDGSVCVDVVCDSNLVRGDANGDGSLNGLDVVYFVAYLKGGPSICLGCVCPGDANNDGNANGLDVTYLLTYFKGGPGVVPCN